MTGHDKSHRHDMTRTTVTWLLELIEAHHAQRSSEHHANLSPPTFKSFKLQRIHNQSHLQILSSIFRLIQPLIGIRDMAEINLELVPGEVCRKRRWEQGAEFLLIRIPDNVQISQKTFANRAKLLAWPGGLKMVVCRDTIAFRICFWFALDVLFGWSNSAATIFSDVWHVTLQISAWPRWTWWVEARMSRSEPVWLTCWTKTRPRRRRNHLQAPLLFYWTYQNQS